MAAQGVPTKKISYAEYVKKPAFEIGMLDYALGKALRQLDDLTDQFAYERGRQYGAATGRTRLKHKAMDEEAARYSALRIAKVIL